MSLTHGRYGVGYLGQGRGSGFRFREKPQFSESVMSRTEHRPIIQSTTKPERHMELGILHVHAVIDLDVVTIDEAGGRVEAGRRNLLHQVGHAARDRKSTRLNSS